jgi:F-type H+-transporting ATPase subunit b
MLIDWFTVGAQALNFLILVWLMKRFLYKPIQNAIEEREKKIKAELDNADKKKAEAQKESDEFKHKNEEFEKHRAELLSKATDEVKAERQRLLDEARKAADTLSAKRQETLRNEENNLQQAISQKTQHEVFAIARKTLSDLATISLEERLVEVFTRRLREMDGHSKAILADAVKKAKDPAIVRSAFDLPADQRSIIQNALNETFSSEVRIRFETKPDLISGIEFTLNGQKVGWSIADYLVSMEKDVRELLKEKDKPIAKTSSELKPQIAKRAYELYEEQGHKSDSAIQNWNQAEREIRKDDSKPEPKPEVKAETKPEGKTESKPEVKTEAKPDTKTESKAEAKPDTKTESKPEVKAETKPDAKAESKPGVKTETNTDKPKPETKSQ